MRKIIGCSYGIVLCLCLCSNPDIGNAMDNEVWISPIGPDITNVNQYPTNIIGTPSYPFRCADGPSLHYVLSSVLVNTNMTIHLMPGTFSVEYLSNVPPINLLQGWKMRGSGIGNTVLQFSPSNNLGSNLLYFVEGSTNGAEISDLTIDCNLQHQINANTIDAVVLSGNNCRISRVKAINWGSVGTNENFVLNLQPPASGNATNLVIEDCEVTQPASVIPGIKGVTAISIFISGSNTLSVEDGIIRNNLVHDIQVGTSSNQVYWLYAYGGGPIVTQNRARNIPGGSGYYWDSFTVQDVVIDDNTFDNVSVGVYFNGATNLAQNIIVKNNVIRPSQGGWGVIVGRNQPTNLATTNFVLMDNVIFPSDTATSSGALAVVTPASLNVTGNILDGGASSEDVLFSQPVPYWANWYTSSTGVLGLAWQDNVNLPGTQLNVVTTGGSPIWMPGNEDRILFWPTNIGWYRVISNVTFASGSVTVYSAAVNNQSTDLDFDFRVIGNQIQTNTLGNINETRQGSWYNSSISSIGWISMVRIGCFGNNVYLDMYLPMIPYGFSNANIGLPMTITIKGPDRGAILNPPVLITNTTPPGYYLPYTIY
jgi:hypothetical protein